MKGKSPLFGNVGSKLHRSYAGDMTLMGPKQPFLSAIKKRKDVDPNGYFDVIAHGSHNRVELEHNGKTYIVDWREVAHIVKHLPGYHGQKIRLLSCNTGSTTTGFAQSLADKMNVEVIAPNKYLFANPDGTHYVAGGYRNSAGKICPIHSDPGTFIKFTPGGNK